MAAAFVSGFKAVHKPGFGENTVKELAVEINYNALIGQALVDNCAVYGVVLYKQNIPRLQLVVFIFNKIVYFARKKN